MVRSERFARVISKSLKGKSTRSGDNGAGESTLIKLIAGVETLDGGEIRVRGRSVHFGNPHDALEAGIATIHQDLELGPRMTIYRNIFMGSELGRRFLGIRVLDREAMIEESRGHLKRLNASVTDMTTRWKASPAASAKPLPFAGR